MNLIKIIIFIVFSCYVIGVAKILEKMDEDFNVILFPLYGPYVFCKKAYGNGLWSLLMLAPFIIMFPNGYLYFQANPSHLTNFQLIFVIVAYAILQEIVVWAVLTVKLCKTFGKGIKFKIFALFFSPFALLIMGIDNSRYIKPLKKDKHLKKQ
ncbi:DUF5684 domain-containing protein [Butyrivibrio fibrisolvens]|uniref:DUF5684 domain-containing protein n=1 Tax=Butyrivibrio fibrisolvens TaxID=831 RepID=UPI0003B57E06|nr:DUF5684 domain-containing protein [Butyrivibrio fibrisolvens]